MTDPPPPLVNPLTGQVVRTEEEREMIERVMAAKTAGRAAGGSPQADRGGGPVRPVKEA